MIEDMYKYLCSSEVCVDKIRMGLRHSVAELYNLMSRNIATSIQRRVRNSFFSANYYYKDGKMMIYLFDEVDPEKITDYLLDENKYLVERQYVYELVCRIQQKVVNQFYKELNSYKVQRVMEVRFSKDAGLFEKGDYDKYVRAYEKTLTIRATVPYKLIRAK